MPNLPLLQKLLKSSRKSYASVGRRVRPHFNSQSGGGKVVRNMTDTALGQHVASLLTPIIRRRSSTRRSHIQRGGGRSGRTRKGGRVRNEFLLRRQCIGALRRKM